MRKNRLFNVFSGRLGGVGLRLRREVASPRLQSVFLFRAERHLQRVKAAVEFQILRRKAEHIRELRRSGELPHAFAQIIPIVEKASAGPVRQFRHHVRLAKLFRHSVQRADPGGKHRPCKGFRNVASRGARVQPARVNCVDHHVCARGAVDDFRRLPRRKRGEESR